LGLVSETNDVTIDATINRRTTSAQRYAGGNLSDAILLRTILNNDVSFKDGMNYINNTVLEYYKHSNYGAEKVETEFISRFNTPRISHYASTLFTYQSAFSLDDENKCTIKRLPTGKEWNPLYMSIIPKNTDGDYIADYSYMPKLISENDIKDYHNFMINFIFEGIKDENASIQDIIKRAGK